MSIAALRYSAFLLLIGLTLVKIALEVATANGGP
jgi:hypothetical protein